MLLAEPVLYDSQIQHAGGKVVFKYLLNVGNPNLHWLRAGREGDGAGSTVLPGEAKNALRFAGPDSCLSPSLQRVRAPCRAQTELTSAGLCEALKGTPVVLFTTGLSPEGIPFKASRNPALLSPEAIACIVNLGCFPAFPFAQSDEQSWK